MASTIICCSEHLVVRPEPCVMLVVFAWKCVEKWMLLFSTPVLKRGSSLEATGDSSKELM